jgi:hypothetical protein
MARASWQHQHVAGFYFYFFAAGATKYQGGRTRRHASYFAEKPL